MNETTETITPIAPVEQPPAIELVKPKRAPKVPHKRALGEQSFLDAYLEYTDGYESPTIFHQWVALQTIASSLRRNVWLLRGSLIYPNMYTVLVASTGACQKSTAFDLGAQLSYKTPRVRVYRGQITAPQILKAMKDDKNDKGKVEQKGTIITMADREDSLYLINDELANFMTETNRDAIASMLTDLYNPCDDYGYQTRTRGCIELKNTCLNLLLATNPRWLSISLKDRDFDGGFAGRINWIYADTPRKRNGWVQRGPEHTDMRHRLQDDLHHISENLKGEFCIHPEAKATFKHWDETRHRDYTNTKMVGFQERKATHVLKTAMLLAVAESDSRLLMPSHIAMAHKMVNEIEERMPWAFRYIGSEDQAISEECLSVITAQRGEAARSVILKAVKHRLKGGIRHFDSIRDMMIEAGEIEMKGGTPEDRFEVWKLGERLMTKAKKDRGVLPAEPAAPVAEDSLMIQDDLGLEK